MAITAAQIQVLATKKNVNQIAVENFLSSLDGLLASHAGMNLSLDARSYKWNAATVNAIRKGISIHYYGK